MNDQRHNQRRDAEDEEDVENVGADDIADGDVALAFSWGDFDDIKGLNNEIIWPQDGQQPIPEPATMLLFGTGLAGFAGTYLRKKKS